MSTPAAPVRRSSPIPMFEQIEAFLREAITGGSLKAHDPLPSESQLAKQWGVSRATAQKAMDHLERDGLIYRRQGKGTYVAAASTLQPFPILFSFGESLRALGHKVDTRVLQKETIRATDDVARALGVDVGRDIIVIKRLRSVDGEPVLIHTSFLDKAVFEPLLDFDLESTPLTSAMEKVANCRVAGSRNVITIASVSADEARLLRLKGSPVVMVVQETALSDEGSVLRYTRGLFRADRFQLIANKTNPPDVNLVFVAPGDSRVNGRTTDAHSTRRT